MRGRDKKPINTYYENLILGPSHGIGVFAGKDFLPGEIVEIAPLIFDDGSSGHSFGNFVFEPHIPGQSSALALGFGSLYNHNDDPNVTYYHSKGRFMIYVANEFIPKGTELTISYGDHWWDNR